MTDVDRVRILIGDQAKTSFTDDEVQFLLDTSGSSLFLAAALACDSLAAKVGANLQEVRIGDYTDYSGRQQVAALQAQAEAFRTLEYDTPAFAVVEENLSTANALEIIRNYVLRTEA